MNTFGRAIRLTTFGESHGPAIGGVLDGMPPCVLIDPDRIREEMGKRAPGRLRGTSQRREPDEVEILSGISREGLTLGTPIGFIIRNRDHRSEDYAEFEGRFRPNHADYTYYTKYGIHEFTGGGRSSARETASWVAAAAICRQWLETFGIYVTARFVETNPVAEAAAAGDTTGGIVEGEITGLPAGLGEPVFNKFHAALAGAMMSINAVKAFEYGDGVKAASSFGSESADIPYYDRDISEFRFRSNHSGGVQGGITNGEPVNFRVYFKPAPTLMRTVETVDIHGEKVTIPPAGRHDACVAIRGAAVVEAMAVLTASDFLRQSAVGGL